MPNIPLGNHISINIGGGIIPIIIAVYLLVTSDTNKEKIRAIFATLVTGVAIYTAGRLFASRTGHNDY